jgi:hypothetical protein
MTSAGLRARDAPAGNSTGGAGTETEDDGAGGTSRKPRLQRSGGGCGRCLDRGGRPVGPPKDIGKGSWRCPEDRGQLSARPTWVASAPIADCRRRQLTWLRGGIYLCDPLLAEGSR